MSKGIIELNWTFIWQLFNTILWIGVIYLIFKVVIKIPKRIKENEARIDKLEKEIEEMKK